MSPAKTPTISSFCDLLMMSTSSTSRFASFSCNRREIHIFIGWKHFTQSFSTSGFHFLQQKQTFRVKTRGLKSLHHMLLKQKIIEFYLSIPSNFDWFIVIPRIVKMLSLCKGKFFPTQMIHSCKCYMSEHSYKSEEKNRVMTHCFEIMPEFFYLLIQSSLKTPLSALALKPGGSTHLIGG